MKVELVKKDYVDNLHKDIAKTKVFSFSTIQQLKDNMKKYPNYILNCYNDAPVTIGNITISAWTRFFIPISTPSDNFAIAIYPDASRFYIIGMGGNTWFCKQII